ncbi:MBL fold metallo-hydrolase [Alkalihalobacillus sp. BA299]|uniref:MBL fold metallo-hydrolase n=1 Tax=Alkalihalobacillus sp. BA299 TaxID=2815938 RepID=UPI001ADC8CE6|nr:MBL fold metallo-hydrolase [Alkalihalobacillus sp. BA299]
MAEPVYGTMQIKVLGGAGEYGRTSVLITNEKGRFLFDCGTNKSGATTEEQYPLLSEEIAASIDAVFISHSHEDHCSALGYLYALGYDGPVYCTNHTARQIPYYLENWRKNCEEKGYQLPYSRDDERKINIKELEGITGIIDFLDLGVKIQWGSSGHIYGAVWYILFLGGKKIFFSGDYHMESPLFSFLKPDVTNVDVAILDTAYGLDERDQQEYTSLLFNKINTTIKNDGSVFLPVPKYGRGQELLLLALNYFSRDILRPLIVVEASILLPLQNYIKDISWLKSGIATTISSALNEENIVVVTNQTEREKALKRDRPKLIFSPDGMLQSTVANAYLQELKDDSKNLILLTGYQSKHSLGQQLLEKNPYQVQIDVSRFKVHPGFRETRKIIGFVDPKTIIVMHNKKEENDQVAQFLKEQHQLKVFSLMSGDAIRI